ncbi:MAG TPA: 1,4-alpha-glucan branching protein domain-containing protein [Jatrophihabitans sp.]|nr:1,4-alpha-glucan branching protein domain-containing protein [Jatrophihabitans sp.]
MRPVGSFALVLHTHLPWVAHNGAWPVGEEWLHQAFTGSWRRVVAVLDELARHGHRDVLTLGVTPVVAAMLDDPYCLAELHGWAGRWQLRAGELATRPGMAGLAGWEHREATACLADLEARWLTGGLTGTLRPLIDAGVIELLSGPATHPFLPLLTERFADAQLRTGLADTELRLGRRVPGIWAPECGYAPGLAERYARHGIGHFVVDGPALRGDTGLARPVGDTGVLAFGRDLPVAERIWSSRTGYPAGPAYRDFHALDDLGFRPARVTGRDDKAPWLPDRAAAAVLRDARDFTAAVVRRLAELAERQGRPGLVVAAFDTELFGHWWYEGPQFLAAVLRMLPQAGVRLTTLASAAAAGLVGGPVELPTSSWGAGKDWRIWDNDQVTPLNEELAGIQKRLFTVLDERCGDGFAARDPVLDQLAREALLASSSDWAFMITRDSAAGYAWQRAREHAARFHELADALPAGTGAELAARLRALDGAFGHLDARQL